MTKTATKIRPLTDFLGEAALYQLTPPLDDVAHVAVSAVVLSERTGRMETMIFPADASGEIASWNELAAIGKWSHEDALVALGYEVAS